MCLRGGWSGSRLWTEDRTRAEKDEDQGEHEGDRQPDPNDSDSNSERRSSRTHQLLAEFVEFTGGCAAVKRIRAVSDLGEVQALRPRPLNVTGCDRFRRDPEKRQEQCECVQSLRVVSDFEESKVVSLRLADALPKIESSHMASPLSHSGRRRHRLRRSLAAKRECDRFVEPKRNRTKSTGEQFVEVWVTRLRLYVVGVFRLVFEC